MYIQDLAGVAHDDIDPTVFSISGDQQMVRCPYMCKNHIISFDLFGSTLMSASYFIYVQLSPDHNNICFGTNISSTCYVYRIQGLPASMS